jgi:hypothetical protein
MLRISIIKNIANLSLFLIFFLGQFEIFPYYIEYIYLIFFLIVSLFGIFYNFHKIKLHAFTLILISYLFSSFILSTYNNKPFSQTYHYLISGYVILFLSSFSNNDLKSFLKNFFIIISILSILSILNTLTFLTYNTCYTFFGNCKIDFLYFSNFTYPRFSSFVKEPSALFCYFLIPVIIFSYEGSNGIKSFFVLLMIALSFSGTFILILIIFLTASIFLNLFNNKYSLFTLTVTLIIIFFFLVFYFLPSIYNREDLSLILNFGEGLNKTSSGYLRIEKILDLIENKSIFLTGYNKNYDIPSGLFISAIVSGGFFTLIPLFICIVKFTHDLSLKLKKSTIKNEKYSIIFLISYMFVVFFFNDYGFNEYAGYILFFISYRLIINHNPLNLPNL